MNWLRASLGFSKRFQGYCISLTFTALSLGLMLGLVLSLYFILPSMIENSEEVKNYRTMVESLVSQVEDQNEELIYLRTENNSLSLILEEDDKKIKEQDVIIKELKGVLDIREDLSNKTDLPISQINFIFETASIRNIPVERMFSLLEIESNFNPEAVNSRSGATGIAQFMPSTARWIASREGRTYSRDKLFNPYYSIELMGAYLELLYNEHGDCRTVLSVYGGYGFDGRYSDYTNRVLRNSQNYLQIIG